jgi:tyrosine-protein kinase Etk/Wzc
VSASLYFVLTAAPLYRAVAAVRLADTRRTLTGSNEGPASELLSRETDILQSQIQVLTSRGVVTDAIDQGGLRLHPAMGQQFPDEITNVQVRPEAANDSLHLTFAPTEVTARARGQQVRAPYGSPLSIGGVSMTVATPPNVNHADFKVVSVETTRGEIANGFKAVIRPKTDVIDLSFVSTDPHYAQRVVNAMAQTFQVHNASNAQQASRRRRQFLEGQMKQTDEMLQRAMNDYASFRSRKGVFSSKEKANAQEQGMVSVEMRRADLDAQRRTYQSLLAQAERNRGSGDPNLRALISAPGIAANPVVQQLYSQLSGYEASLDSLVTSGAAETNPDVQALRTMVSSTSGRLLTAIRNQVTALDASISALDNLKARSTTEIASAPATETEEAQLSQQVQAVQKIADQLQEDYQKARMAEAVEVGQVEILDLADVPTMAVPAGRIRKIALGLILGLMAGVGAAVLMDGLNTSITRRSDVERSLQVPGLGVIPKFGGPNKVTDAARLLPGKKSGGNGKSSRSEGLITLIDPRSASAEAFRTLRTNLIFSQAVQTLRSIVVTSPSPGEGKTTTAANLAVSFAQQGMRVLIIDCDLRRARLHKVFGIPREPGLTDYLVNNVAHESVTTETSVPGLYVMASGPLPPNPAELLGAERMRKALAELGGAYDLIILDTPPLLAASDGAILATMVDGVVLVVRAGSTQTEAGQQAAQQLQSVGARVVGAVVNDPDSKLAQYRGYYSYDYASADN